MKRSDEVKEISVREGDGQWEHFHRPYTHGNANYDWREFFNNKCYGTPSGRHWREETTFVDRNYHGN